MPTNFGTGFGPSFGPSFGFSGWNQTWGAGQQQKTPTKQQKFPGLSEEQIKRLESITSDPQQQQKLYKQAIQKLNNQTYRDNRVAAENEMDYRSLNQNDPRQANNMQSRVRLEKLADVTKDKYGLNQNANTKDVIKGLISMAEDKGVDIDQLNKYLQSGDENFLYELGLKENPREKLKDNFWDSLWNNIKTKANIPVDTVKKWGKRTFNEGSEKIYKSLVKKVLGDSAIGDMGINLDDYVDTITDKTLSPALKEDSLNYQNKINERYRALSEKNLDQDIENYYNSKGYTEALKEGDFLGFLYKSMGDAAQNREMPAVVAASVFQPEVGLALMTSDSYARENQEAFENMMENGASYEQAEKGGVVVGLVNAMIELFLEKAVGGVETSASRAIRKTMLKNVQEEATKKGLGRIVLEGLGTQLRASGEEGLEEWVQQIVQNAAVKTVNENQKLFEGTKEAFEGGFFNLMNLLAGGGNLNQNLQANKSQIRQQVMDGAYTAGVQSRELLDAISNKTQNAENKISGVTDQLYSLDELTKKDIQNNPYSAEVWQRTKNYIQENGRPERSNEVSKALITDVADRVQEKLMAKMKEGGESGRMYKPLLEAGYSVDLSELKSGIDNMLKDYGIKIEDGNLDFSKTAIDGSEASNIKKIYNRIQDTNAPMSLEEYKNRFRQTINDMVDFNQNGRDLAGRKTADTQGDKVLKGIRAAANNLAHNQIPALASLDKTFNERVKTMDEVSDGLVYKDKAKRGVIRDNITQIIKNLDTPNRRELANRLEKLMPGIKEEVRAINMMPKLVDHVYKPSRLQQTITSSAGGIIGTSIGGPVGGIIGAGGGYLLSKWIDKLKSSKWDKVISQTSAEGKAKLTDIQNRIENNEKISQAQRAFLEKIGEELKQGKETKQGEIAQIIADISSAENGDVVSVLNNAIERLETIGAKAEAREARELLEGIQRQLDMEQEDIRQEQEFEAEKENIINESADQRLPEFKERIYKLQQEEMRIGSVAGKKIGKTFEGKDYKNQQETEWLRKKDKLIEEIGEWYNVDQQEASDIYDRIERTVNMDDLGFNQSPASSKTAKYQLADQTNTPEFKKWFEGSKVVDENGKPMVVYHGGLTDIRVFDRSKIGSKTHNKGVFGEGFYFTSDKKYADYYANKARYNNEQEGNVMSVYLDIKNPFMWNEYKGPQAIENLRKELKLPKSVLERNSHGDNGIHILTKPEQSIRFREALQKAGYDGVWYKYDNGTQDEIVAFEPNQIKSATDNIGTFDKNNPDIRYQKYGTVDANSQSITADEGLNIRNFKNGKTVQELAKQYGIDTKIVNKISTPEGQKAYGMYGDRLITLSKDLKESTVPHELLHAVFDMVDQSKRKSILDGVQKKLGVDDVQAEEWLADSFSEYYRTGTFGTQGLAKTFIEKVKQFFYNIKKYIDGTYANERQIRQMFNDIIDGKIEGEYGVYSDPRFQTVWHGSPADFERFDSSHMGEGEGAQAHGRGHYVAVEERTGRHYAELKSGTEKPYEYEGQTYNEMIRDRNSYQDIYKSRKLSEIISLIDEWEQSNGKSLSEVLNNRKNLINKVLEDDKKTLANKSKGTEQYVIDNLNQFIENDEELLGILDEIDVNKINKIKDYKKNKNLYEIEIPDPVKADTPTGKNYIEEDGKLTLKQTKDILGRAMEKVYGKMKPFNSADINDARKVAEQVFSDLSDLQKEHSINDFVKDVEEYAKEYKKSIADAIDDELLYHASLASTLRERKAKAGLYDPKETASRALNGRELYNELEDMLGSDKETSKFLESLGYDGIHYFGGRDGESYVIFNDDALEIKKHEQY